jgi:hypothetical protein
MLAVSDSRDSSWIRNRAGRAGLLRHQISENLLDRIGPRVAVCDEAPARVRAPQTGPRQNEGRIVNMRDGMIAKVVLGPLCQPCDS